MTVSSRQVAEYLLACFDTLYRVLGEGAANLTNDAYVVRVYESSRAFGAVALELREYLDEPSAEPVAVLEEVLTRSLGDDRSGAMVLFALVVVVGPRLLISLLDARNEPDLGALAPLCERASTVVLDEIRASAEAAKSQLLIDDPVWQGTARDLAETLERAGYVQSLGISR
ncbi:MAG: hypothetical protein HKL86_02490 [Acidimicrobiaceae bacterium]|nr:hypothetical protein [Acidimicrobiaceae bacterium]